MENNFKGNLIVFVREMIWSKGEKAEEQLLSSLDPLESKYYRGVLAFTWLPVQVAAAILEKAVQVLYADTKQGLREIGRIQSKNNVQGMYRILFRFLTISFMLKISSKIWGLYHRKGVPRIEASQNEKRIIFCVENYPELPLAIREITDGFLIGLMELTGVTDACVLRNDQNPNTWKWSVIWGKKDKA